jgi:mannose-6-phosphate isomerase-like protein (cupin superfamily)
MVRYRMESRPLFVHSCHCRWCQRESGAAFALNAMIEADRVVHLGAEPERVGTPSASGSGQVIARCPKCKVALWSNYAGAGPLIRFVRVGTLDDPDLLPPDIHIFTASKQPWVVLPPGTPAVPGYYDRERYWPRESLARREVLAPLIDAYQAESRRRVADGTDGTDGADGGARDARTVLGRDPTTTPGNLYASSDPPATGERFEVLLRHRNLVVERIASSARTTPSLMIQEQDEWVLLLRGSAVLEVQGMVQRISAGDYLFLPAGTPHIIQQVSEGALWLAVHLHPAASRTQP